MWGSIEQSFIQDWDDGYQGEDMLKLNVWTPSLTGKRPVMVYFHGGGFSFGSSYELPSHEGAQMARHHDVVQVSVNHRLNILGFFDLSEIGGPAYADSVNVGMTDLVAALRWVRDNIANFGGDPDSVMIYGQSGGGSKVTTLMGMPSAAGLFHRASAQSGGGGNPPGADQSRALAKQIMVELGLGPNDIGALQKMEWAKLNAAATAAALKINGPAPRTLGMGAMAGTTPRVGIGPTVDGRIITMRSFFEGAPEISKNVPMLIGSVSEEGNRMSSKPTEAEWHTTLAAVIGDAKATALDRRHEEGASGKEHPHAVLRRERSAGAQQRHPHGQNEARPERRAGLCLLFHLAIADAGGRGGLAHGRAGVLLRQRQALRTGHRQHAGGAEAGEEDGAARGQLSPARAIPASLAWLGNRSSRINAPRWYSTTNAAW